MTPDVVIAYNFDAVLAKKYFIVCVPTVYGKLFPRLLCCPDHEFFDPFHLDGCVHEPYLPPPPHPLIGKNIFVRYFSNMCLTSQVP